MKKLLFLFAICMLGLVSNAQTTYNFVIFSEDGEPFYVFVNGIRQNDKPETNIRVTDLNSEGLSVRVEFENKALPKLKQNMMGEPGYEHTVIIRKNKKQELKMQYFGRVALSEAPKGNSTNVAYHTDENPIVQESATISEPVSTHNTTSITNSTRGNTSTTVTTTSTSSEVRNNNDNVSVNINLAGLNMNVNATDPNAKVHSSTSTTVTTTSSSSSSGPRKGKNPYPQANPTTQQVETSSGCITPMSNSSYEQLKKSVESKPFSDTKMSTAKIGTKNSCLSLSQVKGICALFSMDDDKLTYAKYAYDYCSEKNTYYQLSDVFSFSGTTEDFNKFLEAK